MPATDDTTKARALAVIRGLKSGAIRPASTAQYGHRAQAARDAAESRTRRARALVPVAAARFIEAGRRRGEAEDAARDAAELWRDLAQDRARARRYEMRQKW